MNAGNTMLTTENFYFPMDHGSGFSKLVVDDFDLVKAIASAIARPHGFEEGFFRGKPCG